MQREILLAGPHRILERRFLLFFRFLRFRIEEGLKGPPRTCKSGAGCDPELGRERSKFNRKTIRRAIRGRDRQAKLGIDDPNDNAAVKRGCKCFL